MILRRYLDADPQGEGTQTGAPNTETPSNDQGTPQNVPYDRFKAKVEEVNNYKTQLEQLQGEFTNLQEKIKNMDDPNEIKSTYETRIKELEKQNIDNIIKSEFKSKAKENGVINVDDFVSLVGLDELKYENGKVLGLDAILEREKNNRSYLFNQQTTKKNIGGGATPPNATTTTEKQLSIEELSKLSISEINAYYEKNLLKK